MNIKIVTLTGPSCAGKTTLARRLLDTGYFTEIVSFTTREPRAGEEHGEDYYFMGRAAASKLIDEGQVIEHTEFKGHIYGITKAEIEARLLLGQVPLSIVEPHGLKQIKAIYGRGVYSIYIDSPLETLIERFLERFKQDVLEYAGTLTHYYAIRLAGLMQEQTTWCSESFWDFYIDGFGKDNEKSMVKSLVDILVK